MFGKFLLVLLGLTPAALLAANARPVNLVGQVPLLARVECPPIVELAPGETRIVIIRVACNQPWLFDVQTDNPQVRASGRYAGSAGGMEAPGHTLSIILTRAPGAVGPQRTTLITRLVSGSMVPYLPH